MTGLGRTRPVLGLVLVGMLAGFALGAAVSRPSPAASEPPASPASTLVARVSPRPTSRPTARTATPPAPTPRFDCEPPSELPAPDSPVAAPQVQNGVAAIVFASSLYRRGADGRLEARDQTDVPGADWEAGLWFVAAGEDEARLLLAPTGGMVVPLALSPDAAQVALWWLPERRGLAEPPCTGGIYLLSVADGANRLLLRGDWAMSGGEEDDLDPAPGATLWRDPWTDESEPRAYALPAVAFSADGSNVAVIDEDTISLFGPPELGVVRQHVGACSDWAWSAEGSTFVAGCEGMTSAWIVDATPGYDVATVALPLPEVKGLTPGWEIPRAATIGITDAGQVRVARFYGFATGCEVEDCVLPSPAWSVTTLDPGTGRAVSTSATVRFLVDADSPFDTRLAPDGAWIYARTLDTDDARTIEVASGEIHPAPAAGVGVGQAIEGGRLFVLTSGDPDRVLLASFGRSGSTRPEATLRLPQGASTTNGSFPLAGLLATLPAR